MRSRKSGKAESGQGIAYVLVLSAALLVFLIAIVDLIWTESRALHRLRQGEQLFHETDAAVDRAIFALTREGNWDAVPQGAVAGYQGDVTYDDIPGILYRIKVQEGNWTPYDPAVDVEATWIPAGDVESERTITVWASRTPTGDRRKLQVVVIKSTLTSALFSGGGINITGSSDIHWGPVVSYSEASDSILLPKGIPTHGIFISKGGILISGSPPTIDQECSYPMAGKCVDSESTTLKTLPPINWNNLKNRALANVAQTGNPLFYQVTTCNQNKIELPIVSGMTEDTVVFFDTIDGKAGSPVNWDGGRCFDGTGNGTYVKLEGNACGKGNLVIMGDFNSKGTGCEQSVTMTPPPDCKYRFDMFDSGCDPIEDPTLLWDGEIYVANKLISSGNKKIYGTVYAKDSAGIGGSFEIWYKSTNSDLGVLGKNLNVAIWLPRKPFTTIDPASGYIEAFPE